MTEDNNILEKVKVLGIEKVIPSIYEDGIKPATQELGKGLVIVAKTINLALSPLSGLVWGYEKIQEYVVSSLSKKFENIPAERIVTPKAIIVGPLLESLRYAGNEEHLREMFINLLATSMDKKHIQNAHPAFVEIIKQLCPSEAALIKHIATNYPLYQFCSVHSDNDGYYPFEILKDEFVSLVSKSNIQNPELALTYLDNFIRLKLIEMQNASTDQNIEKYQPRFDPDRVMYSFNQLWYEDLSFSSFGVQFVKACVL